MPNFLFDVKLKAAFRLDAKDQATAEAMLRKLLDCADAHYGQWPHSLDPVIAETWMDGEPLCVEIDGEEPSAGPFPSPLDYFIAARQDGWYASDEDTPEEYCGDWDEDRIRESIGTLSDGDLKEYRRELHEYQQR